MNHLQQVRLRTLAAHHQPDHELDALEQRVCADPSVLRQLEPTARLNFAHYTEAKQAAERLRELERQRN